MRHNRLVLLVAIFAAMGIGPARANSCAMLQNNYDEAVTMLNRAGRAAALQDAQNYVRRALSALEEASLAARACRCEPAALEFENAAARARAARIAGSAPDFQHQLRRAAQAVNSAADMMQACKRS